MSRTFHMITYISSMRREDKNNFREPADFRYLIRSIIVSLVIPRQSERRRNLDFIDETVGDLEKRAVTMPKRAGHFFFSFE